MKNFPSPLKPGLAQLLLGIWVLASSLVLRMILSGNDRVMEVYEHGEGLPPRCLAIQNIKRQRTSLVFT